jgi:hypothetical protein
MSWLEMLQPSDQVDKYLRLSFAILLFIFNAMVATNIETPFPSLLVEAYSIPLTRIALLVLVLLSAMWCPSVGIMAALAYVSLGADVLFFTNKS